MFHIVDLYFRRLFLSAEIHRESHYYKKGQYGSNDHNCERDIRDSESEELQHSFHFLAEALRFIFHPSAMAP